MNSTLHIPKAEIHVHLEATITPDLCRKFARRNNVAITENVFGNKCAYCETTDRGLTLDHVDMINRTSLGLHHPGNTVPCCKICQSRKPEGRKYPSWEEHLLNVCKNRDENDYYKSRFLRIKKHRENGKYALPNLSDNAKEALRIICEKLYLDVKNQCLDSVNLYEKLVLAFVND